MLEHTRLEGPPGSRGSSNAGSCPTLAPIENGKKFRNQHDGEEAFDQQQYQEMVGAINYAAVATHGDLSFAIGLLGHFAADSTMDMLEESKGY